MLTVRTHVTRHGRNQYAISSSDAPHFFMLTGRRLQSIVDLIHDAMQTGHAATHLFEATFKADDTFVLTRHERKRGRSIFYQTPADTLPGFLDAANELLADYEERMIAHHGPRTSAK